jgi:flagellin-like hook-associated protein FlgL
MASNITLSAGVKQNLLSLQKTADLMATTQNRLATGKKVNSALDNPTNFFTSASLQSRAGDLNSLLDSMSNGIKTLEAADNGLSAITKTVESMQSTLRQARQDKSFKTESYTIDSTTIGTTSAKTLQFSGGAVGTTAVSIALNTTGAGSAATAGTYTSTANFAATTLTDAVDTIAFDIAVDGGSAVSVTIDQTAVQAVGNNDTTIDDVAELNTILTNAGVTGVTASIVSSKLVLTSSTTGASSSVAISNYVETDADTDTTDGTGFAAGASAAGVAAVAAGAVKTVDELVTAINANTGLTDKIRASNDNGKLRIENLSTSDLTVTGVGTDGEIDGTTGTSTIGGNDVRKNLAKQFNELRDQLDKLADDASFNGINLLRGDKLKLTFNETGTSTIEIQAKDSDGAATSVNATNLGITTVADSDFDTDTTLDAKLSTLSDALGSLRSQASGFGSNLSIVQNRQEFTKATINTLQTGADNLVLADSNEEAANLLALQTRQQLSSTALSLASQADQAVLRLF